MSTVGGLAIAPEPSLRRRVGISARPVDLEGLVFFNSFPTNSLLIEDLLKTWRALGERPGHEASSDFCDYGAEVMCKTPCDLPRLMSKASGSFQTTYISTSVPRVLSYPPYGAERTLGKRLPIFEHFVLVEMADCSNFQSLVESPLLSSIRLE